MFYLNRILLRILAYIVYFLQHLSQCETVILLKDGRIAEMGPYEELMQDEKVTILVNMLRWMNVKLTV